MHHDYIDDLAHRPGVLRDRDPRAKVLLCGAFVLQVVLVDLPARLAADAVLLLLVVTLARLPPLYLLRRLLLVLPFALAVTALVPFSRAGTALWSIHLGPLSWTLTREGLAEAGLMAARAMLAAGAVLVFVSTTRFSALLHGLRSLGVPRLLVMVLAFLYRYLFVLVDEAMRMRRAALARGLSRRSGLAVAGGLLGSLFLRTWERAERVYRAMVARGFSGEVKLMHPLRFGAADALLLTGGVVVVIVAASWSPV